MRQRRITIFAAGITLMPLHSTRDNVPSIPPGYLRPRTADNTGPSARLSVALARFCVETTRLDILDGIAAFREHDKVYW